MPSGIKMEWNTAGKRRTMGLRGERRLAERRSAVRMPSQKEHQHASKTMKLIPQIDGDETMKCYMVLFLAGGEWIMWLPIWASLICLGQRNRQVIQCSCETALSAVLPILQVTLPLFYLLIPSLTLSSSLSLSVCLPFNPAHLITLFEGGPGLHEYIISSLDRPKELSYRLWDEVSGLQNEFSH